MQDESRKVEFCHDLCCIRDPSSFSTFIDPSLNRNRPAGAQALLARHASGCSTPTRVHPAFPLHGAHTFSDFDLLSCLEMELELLWRLKDEHDSRSKLEAADFYARFERLTT